jgi:Tuberculosis necrotizing toxin
LNRTEVQDALRKAGVPDDLYALPGVRDARTESESHYLLERRPGGFVVAIFERGNERFGRRFFAEDEACRWLCEQLVFDEPRPRELTADEEKQARARTETMVSDVTALVRHAEQVANAATTPYMLNAGSTVDQFGQESGTYLYPDGTPYERRSLPPSVLATSDPRFPNNYHRYEVVQPFRARAGVTAPAFGQPGGGIQFRVEPGFFTEAPALLSIRWLLRTGYLRRIASG